MLYRRPQGDLILQTDPPIESHYGNCVCIRPLENFPQRPLGRAKVTFLYQIQPLKNFKKNKKSYLSCWKLLMVEE